MLRTYRDHLALSWHVGRAVAQAELGLQCVEVGLQLSFLLNTWWFVLAPESFMNSNVVLCLRNYISGLFIVPVSTVVLQLLLASS